MRIVIALRMLPTTCSIARLSACAFITSRRSMATAISTPMRTMTTTSSSSEKPVDRCAGRRLKLAVAARRARQLPHRQEDTEREDQHQDAHHDQQDRLDLGGQPLDLELNLALVEVRHVFHHGVDF